ncbi:helix-turn-helix transcriptional regulator [Vibrio rotiferianus]
MDKWNERLDKLKEKWGLPSDRALAKVMGLSQAAIQKIRTGKNEPSALTKLMIMDRLGFTAAKEMLTEIMPEEQRKQFLSRWNKTTK